MALAVVVLVAVFAVVVVAAEDELVVPVVLGVVEGWECQSALAGLLA